MKTTEELEEIYDSEPYEWIALWKNRGVWVKITNPSFIHGCHYQLIHIKHKEVLEAWLADNNVEIEAKNDKLNIPFSRFNNFIEKYNPDLEYRLKETKMEIFNGCSCDCDCECENNFYYRQLKEKDNEDNRLSSDTDTTMDNSVDSDNILSKMTIPIIEVDEEIDRGIDEYLSKQDGYREVRMVACKSCGFSSESGAHTCNGLQFGTEESEDEHQESELDLGTFNERGFETPDFKGEILKEVGGCFIGYFETKENHIFPILWDKYNGEALQYRDIKVLGDKYNLTPIPKHWYENPDNFPALLVWDSGIDTPSYRSTISKDSFIKLHRQGWKLATKEEVNSLYCEG